MAAILKELKGGIQYRDRKFPGDDEEYRRALKTSCTVYVGNLAFTTREEQLYEVFGKVGPIDRVIMGLNSHTRSPCGFAFVIYYTAHAAQAAASFITGTKVDSRVVRVDVDWGFEEGRQYGRGRSGGQVRDEMRQHFDSGRGGQPMNAVYEDGMGREDSFRPGGKRPRQHSGDFRPRPAPHHPADAGRAAVGPDKGADAQPSSDAEAQPNDAVCEERMDAGDGAHGAEAAADAQAGADVEMTEAAEEPQEAAGPGDGASIDQNEAEVAEEELQEDQATGDPNNEEEGVGEGQPEADDDDPADPEES